jgi:hypothetical protein
MMGPKPKKKITQEQISGKVKLQDTLFINLDTRSTYL